MAAASFSSSKSLLRWRQGDLIGAGAFGCVYMGMNLDSGELLAVKQVLIPSSSCQKAQAHLKELEEEVKLLQSLSHPNIVRYLGTARDNNALNIFLEFVPGGSIASLLNKFGPFPEMVIKMYTRQILQGLDYLHKNGIMHRDIKGANILVDNKGQIKLADFGASKQVVELVTTMVSKSIKGTPYWMAPEVIRQTGHTLSADIWSVACTVIEMATGKAPWSDQFQEVSALFHIGTTKSHPPIPENLSHAAQDFLHKCLQQEPQLRPTASELLEHPFVEVEGSLKGVRPIQPSGVVDRCKRRQLNTQRVENPCFSNCLDHSAKGRTSSELFTPDRNHVKAHIETVLNCSMRFDHHDVMMETSNPMMESLTLKTMENQPDVDDVLCNLASPEIMRNRKNGNSPRAMANSSEDDSPSVCFFNCMVDENNEEDDDVTEAKIKAFLEEKAMELKQLQSPLYEGFHSSWNVERNLEVSSITSCEEQIRDAILPQSWLSRASSQSGISTARSSGSDSSSISSGTYGNSSHRTDLSLCSDSTTQHHDLKEDSLSELQHSSSYSLSVVSSADQLKLWKEELQQELQMRREEKKMLLRLATSTNLSQGTTRSLKRKQV